MLSSSMVFCGGKKKRLSQFLKNNSCGLLILVMIIPVKVDWILTGIIRTYKIILVLES